MKKLTLLIALLALPLQAHPLLTCKMDERLLGGFRVEMEIKYPNDANEKYIVTIENFDIEEQEMVELGVFDGVGALDRGKVEGRLELQDQETHEPLGEVVFIEPRMGIAGVRRLTFTNFGSIDFGDGCKLISDSRTDGRS